MNGWVDSVGLYIDEVGQAFDWTKKASDKARYFSNRIGQVNQNVVVQQVIVRYRAAVQKGCDFFGRIDFEMVGSSVSWFARPSASLTNPLVYTAFS